MLKSQRTAQQPIKRPRTLSLFTGAGGLDIGFHRAGFDIIACIEMEEVFCDTIRLGGGKYFPERCQVLNQDIQAVEPQALGIEPIHVIIGGPPCQSFSAAGRRAGGAAGLLDERGSLFSHYCRIVRYFRPKVFIFENVRGILHCNKGKDWEEISAAFQQLGYSLFHKVLDAADYGVPQYRERLILAGVDGLSTFLFPRPTHGPDSLDNTPHVSAGEAIADLQPKDEPVHDYGGKYGDLLRKVPPGMNYHFFTREMGCPSPVFAWRSRFSDFLYKAAPNKPTKTIVAKLGRYSGPFHWKSRKFTLAEFKRLQSFPDDFELAGTLNQQLQQVGNSVAPKFAEALATAVMSQLFDPSVSIELIPHDYKLSFDGRKGAKARETRRLRLKSQRPADDVVPAASTRQPTSTRATIRHTQYYVYESPKKRQLIPHRNHPPADAFRFKYAPRSTGLVINVSRGSRGDTSQNVALEYNLDFYHPIGAGIRNITARLRSGAGAHITMLWDAVEVALRTFTDYNSLIDIYGHFTEPHPIFTLGCSITPGNGNDPILRFAHYFSCFENTTHILPAAELKAIMGITKKMKFLDQVRALRELRFDVRVYETNVTIPPSMFRCCYPFALGYGKQISVSWHNRENGNRELVL